MAKMNLPIILVKGIVLLPHNEIRLEFDSRERNTIIESSKLFHNNKLLIISGLDPKQATPSTENLPRIGVIGEVVHDLDLPNGKRRLIIKGLVRARVLEYIDMAGENCLESIVEEIPISNIDSKTETILIRKLYHEVQDYTNITSFMSNNALSLILGITNLDKLTDVIVPHLPVSYHQIVNYLNTLDATKRADMLLKDIYDEKQMYELEMEIDSKVQNEINNSQKEYYIRERIKALKEELKDNSDNDASTLKEKIDNLKAPEYIIKRLNKEMVKYESLNVNAPEKSVVDNYIHWLLDLPWEYKTEDNSNLKQVKKLLNKSHYGLEDVKVRIIEYLAVKKMTNSLKAPIICLVGPPGVGKTSLAFSIAKAINRNFVKMSVGGIRDVNEIMGHRRTYVGASPGRIIECMKKAESINPLFLIDEIDKMSHDYNGDPASALLEVLDPEQNRFFSDNYIEEEYDLSNVMFIATANNIEDIPEALKDRLEIVTLSGYTEYEKLDIAKKHLLPKICESHGLDIGKLHISDDVILDIIRFYTREAGVRELERQISNVIRKIVTNIVMNAKEMDLYEVDNKLIKKYLGPYKYSHIKGNESAVGVVNGLAFTNYGGELLPIEVNYFKGSGNLVLTGQLGEVFEESAKIAFSYVKANASNFAIDYNLLMDNDIHIHVPEGAIPKDGPSAGVALTTALISSLTKCKINKDIAMTGEITLRGNVLAIGGLKEKSIGAYRNGVKTIIIPSSNARDLVTIPSEIRKDINYVMVDNYQDVFNYINGENKNA